MEPEETRLDAHIYGQLAEFIKQAYETAKEQHEQFSKQELKGDCAVKAYKDHQDACKAGINNISLIIKLAQQAVKLGEDLPDENEENALQALIENAREELRQR